MAAFVLLSLILGGGGTPNPATELLLELLFVAAAVAWLWLSPARANEPGGGVDPLAYALLAIPIIIPLVQLIALPPSIWTVLPGRNNEVAALSLVGAQSSWRPISLSPSRTLASLLSVFPPLFCFFGVSRLAVYERRLILASVLLIGLITCLLGVVQLSAGGNGLNLYPEHHVGWVTGFEANRNATADVLLVCQLALAVLVAPYLADSSRRKPLHLSSRSLAFLVAGQALILVAATVMTGSRTGITLILLAGACALLILSINRTANRALSWPGAMVLVAALGTVATIIGAIALGQNTALARVAARFSDLDTSRAVLWSDTWFALKQYWPVGFGMGGFEPAMLPAESLEVLDQAIPNRAHNDFLEIGLEAGLFGYVLVTFAVILCLALAWRAWQRSPGMRRQVIFGLGVLIMIALHSVIDYPLRSMAVASLAGVAGGMLVRNTASTGRSVTYGTPEMVKGQA